MVTATIIMCNRTVVCAVYCGDSNSRYSEMVLSCVGVYCCYSNRRYSAMVLCCVYSLFWLQQQQI